MTRRDPDELYAAQWPILTFGFVFFGVANAIQAGPETRVFAVVLQLLFMGGVFIAGFCYRERLHQIDRRPRWRVFRRMMSD